MSNSTTETETSHAKIDMLHGSIWNKLPRYALPVAGHSHSGTVVQCL